MREKKARKIRWASLLLAIPLQVTAPLTRAEGMSIADTVVKPPLAEDVSMDDAVDPMLLRTNALNDGDHARRGQRGSLISCRAT